MGLFVFGCKKGKQDVKSGDDGKSKPTASDTGDANARKAPTPGEVKVATGDLRDLLLALKRVHFALDANTLTEGGRNALDEAAEKLKALPKVALYVDGHTDERGTTEYNMGLGERRAQTVVDYLTRLGIKGERLNTVTFGEELPLGSGSGELQLAKNRLACDN